jgi:hypothetical protein
MGASCVHERVARLVGAFYAPRAREGNQILQIKAFKSVDTIRGHPNKATDHHPCSQVTKDGIRA